MFAVLLIVAIVVTVSGGAASKLVELLAQRNRAGYGSRQRWVRRKAVVDMTYT